MTVKKIFKYLPITFLALLYITGSINANRFLNIISLPVEKKIDSFDLETFKNNIGFLIKSKNNLLYLFSNNQGKSFKNPIKITDKNILGYTLALNKQSSVILWIEERKKAIKFAVIDHKKNKIKNTKTLYFFKGETAYSSKILFDNEKLLLIYIDHYKNNAIVKFLKFNTSGKIIYNHAPYEQGYNFLPQIKINNNQYLLVWNNITGSREEILYTYSMNKGKSWKNIEQLIYNDFKDRTPRLQVDNKNFYLTWQDNHLGNWNISYAKFENNEWANFMRLTSGLINCWMPQCGIYKNQFFVTWLDKSKGESQIFYKKKFLNQNIWSSFRSLNKKINNINSYKMKTSENFLILAYLKNNQIKFSKLYSIHQTIHLYKEKIKNNGIKIAWKSNKEDIDQFAINFSKKRDNNFFTPVLNKNENEFYIYVKNHPSDNIFFNLKYYDDIGVTSEGSSIKIFDSKKKSKYKHIQWKKIDNNKLYYNFIENKLYLKIKYQNGMTREKILNKLYFYPINKMNIDNDIYKNKFIKVFNLINGNIDFNRLIKGDEIFLPVLWENSLFLSRIKNNLKTTLKNMEVRYKLKDIGYLYYIVSEDLLKIKKYQQTKKNDFVVIMCLY